MGWPLNKDDKKSEVEVKPNDEKKDEKSAAELIAAAFAPIKDRLDQVDQKFTDFETRYVAKPSKPEDDATKKSEDKRVSIFDNEDLGIAQRMAPLAAETLNTRFELMYDRTAREYIDKLGVDTWKQIEPEVRKMLESCDNLLLRANPVYIKNTVRLVMGEKAESGFRFDSTGKRFFLEDASASADSAARTRNEAEGLSQFPKTRARQLKAMKSFGMTAEEYKKSLGDLEVVSDV